jgi:hypothetical protein
MTSMPVTLDTYLILSEDPEEDHIQSRALETDHIQQGALRTHLIQPGVLKTVASPENRSLTA